MIMMLAKNRALSVRLVSNRTFRIQCNMFNYSHVFNSIFESLYDDFLTCFQITVSPIAIVRRMKSVSIIYVDIGPMERSLRWEQDIWEI